MLTMNITQSHNPFVSQSLILGSVNGTPTEEKKVFTSQRCTWSNVPSPSMTYNYQIICNMCVFAFKVLGCNINHCFPYRHSELHFILSRTIFTFLSVDINFDYLQLPYTRCILFAIQSLSVEVFCHFFYLPHLYCVL